MLRRFGRQRWLPFGLRDRILRKLADPDSMPSTPFNCAFFGLRYQGDLSSFIDWSVYFYGVYELGILSFLREATRQAGPGAVVLDIGANVGQHSLFLSAHAARIHAFEPWQPARDAILRNIGINRIENIEVHEVGLSDHAHDAVYYAPTLANKGTGSFLAGHNLSNREAGRLPLVDGDSYLAARGIDRVDVIKLDAEGFEPRVLAGLAGTIARCRPVMVLEENAASTDPIAFERLGEGWERFTLAGGPEHYRLEPYLAPRDGATVVLAPTEKARALRPAG
ncbi:hypothetical protein WV31_13305 [Magnetospirillum sp. ME-1]|nr:hypothetical protein WV31_13305 [Magnetospirillum sp. ME-1]